MSRDKMTMRWIPFRHIQSAHPSLRSDLRTLLLEWADDPDPVTGEPREQGISSFINTASHQEEGLMIVHPADKKRYHLLQGVREWRYLQRRFHERGFLSRLRHLRNEVKVRVHHEPVNEEAIAHFWLRELMRASVSTERKVLAVRLWVHLSDWLSRAGYRPLQCASRMIAEALSMSKTEVNNIKHDYGLFTAPGDNGGIVGRSGSQNGDAA